MHFGTYMGVYWILKFILFPLGLSIPFLLFLFFGLTLGVPFMGYYYARTYRDKVCGGSIRFLQAWVFIVFMYMFAALLTAVAHYIYFRFIDHGFIVNTYMGMFDELSNKEVPGIEGYISQLKEVMEMISTLTPIDITYATDVTECVLWQHIGCPHCLVCDEKAQITGGATSIVCNI